MPHNSRKAVYGTANKWLRTVYLLLCYALRERVGSRDMLSRGRMTSPTARVLLSVACMTILPLLWALIALIGFHSKAPIFHVWDSLLLATVPGLVVGVAGLLIFPSPEPVWKRILWRGMGAVLYVALMGALLLYFYIAASVLFWGSK